jgi:mono/diheme cytochrome c family protein
MLSRPVRLARSANSLEPENSHPFMKTPLRYLALASLAVGLTLPASLQAADAAVLANYKKHCASCHGPDGKGETKMGRKAGAKDYTDKATVAAIKDDVALGKIKEGIKEKGKEIKKPFQDKLKDEEIVALIAYMKAFAK